MFNEIQNIKVCDLSNYEGVYQDDLPARSPYAHKVSNLSMHITHHAFLTIAGREVAPSEMAYLQLDPIDVSSFNLPEKYVVVTTGFTSSTRAWNAKSVKDTTDYIVSKGYTPVYLGKSLTESFITKTKQEVIKGNFVGDYSNGINLIDRTNLFEAHAIMANAACVVGLDNGLLHLAAMSDVPIVYGFTTVLPEHRLPYRINEYGFSKMGHNCHVVMPTKEELRCIGCQSNMTFMDSSHSFTKCAYGDYACLDLISSDKWIAKLENLL